jgi:hypothetical protein
MALKVSTSVAVITIWESYSRKKVRSRRPRVSIRRSYKYGRSLLLKKTLMKWEISNIHHMMISIYTMKKPMSTLRTY